MKTFKKVVPYIRKNLFKIIFGIILIIIIDAGQLITIKVIQKAIDGIGKQGFTATSLLYASLLILGITIVITILRYFWRIAFIGTAWIIDRDLRQMFYDHLLKLSPNFFNKTKTGDLMAYATNDMNAVRMLIGFGFVVGADIIVLSIASLFFMVGISLRLTLLAIIPMPILSVIIIYFGKEIHGRFRKIQKIFAAMSGKVQETISGIRVVKVFVQEQAELEKMSEQARDYVKENIALVKIFAMFHPMLFLVVNISMGIVLIFGGESTIFNEISIGEFVAFFQFLGMLIWPMIAIGWIVNLYQRGTASLKRLNSIFEVEPEVIDENADVSIQELKGKVTFKNLNFQYNSQTPQIFENISFEIDVGKTLAIVGRTGCGKTTIIDLMTRVYNPPQNAIFIDDVELFKIPLEVLRDNVVMVPQDIFLFSDSIADNISMAKPDIDRTFVEEVARYAQVYDEIINFEDGFDTVIGERGVTLSGGQKQRIAIARALLTNPNVLILDDALSSVDTKTEKKILELLIELRRDKTTIIIAHRISSLQHADKIIVLGKKKIAESGTHKELLAKNGIYKNLFEKQQIEEKLK